MQQKNIKIVLAANYFDEQKIRTVASRTNAEAVIVPLYVGGAAGIDNYFELVDYWVDELLKAAEKKGIVKNNDL
jgi:ABC-type Zn uptake system ZnuABC Zn-binding protein ZnuA